ncbi:hypothetical protein [Streptomyces bobili]|uniref:hypothetical protein n=1 Tax=Streptomyces bobili TaxID=67280 RepID=UPI001FC94519|nr:hypothetical protein [Streptomyces bobili]
MADLGYLIVPEELLERDYDGPSRLPSHVQRPSWWHRFFGISDDHDPRAKPVPAK